MAYIATVDKLDRRKDIPVRRSILIAPIFALILTTACSKKETDVQSLAMDDLFPKEGSGSLKLLNEIPTNTYFLTKIKSRVAVKEVQSFSEYTHELRTPGDIDDDKDIVTRKSKWDGVAKDSSYIQLTIEANVAEYFASVSGAVSFGPKHYYWNYQRSTESWGWSFSGQESTSGYPIYDPILYGQASPEKIYSYDKGLKKAAITLDNPKTVTIHFLTSSETELGEAGSYISVTYEGAAEPKAEKPSPTPAPEKPTSPAVQTEKPTSTTPAPAISGFVGASSAEGTVYAPNGVDVVDNALVYVPFTGNVSLELAGIPKSQGPNTCGEPKEAYITKTCTTAHGNFLFKVLPVGKVLLKIQKGLFTLVSYVQTYSGKMAQVSRVESTLPKQTSDKGTIPKIAVVLGSYDHIEKVLDSLGLKGQFTTYDNVIGLLHGGAQATLNQYDALFINCGTSETCTSVDSYRDLLRSYVEKGGRLYVTDQSYDFVEQVFPEYIRFGGSNANQANSTPEAQNSAQHGTAGLVIQAQVRNQSLKEWLSTLSCGGKPCVTQSGEVRIEGFAGQWAMMDTATHLDTQVWVEGNVAGKLRPLTVTFRAGKGKVLYTSYHTHEHSTGRAELSPQERILQYFILDLTQ